jgi:hypothetical protein
MLPTNWFVDLERKPAIPADAYGITRPDAIMTIRAPDGDEATVVIEAKLRLDPRDVPAVMSQLRRYQETLGGGSGAGRCAISPSSCTGASHTGHAVIRG